MMSSYRCTQCGREIKNGEFMAIIGEIPPTRSQLSTSTGWIDKLVTDKIGRVHCANCVLSTNDDERTSAPRQPSSD